MAKRSRGRPVQRRPAARPVSRPAGPARPAASPAPAAAASGPAGLTEAEAARAAELEAALVAQERAAAAAQQAARQRSRGRDYDPVTAGAPLSVRAANEYAYVSRDVRRIAATGGLMLAILFGLAIAINVAGIIKV